MKAVDMLVSVYVDINPVTKKVFYVGVGVPCRVSARKRNKFHRAIVDTIPNKKFIRKVIYKDIPKSKAWHIEMQIIRKCGRIYNNTGYLANIHEGGPLPFEDETGHHWLRGKKIADVLPNYVCTRTGKTYTEIYGAERAKEIIDAQIKNRIAAIQKRIETTGVVATEKMLAHLNRIAERRRRKEYTEDEIASFQRTSERQQGKTMQERLSNLNYVDPRKGKTAKEIYKDPNYQPHNKGKTAKELYGEDYIDPRACSFYIQINDQEPILCNGDRDFREKFKAHDPLLYKLKENKTHIIKRLKNTVHVFPHGSTVKYINIE